MAEKLDDYDFSSKNTGRSRYPFDEWLDGSIWKLKQGEDFSSERSSMRTRLHTEATKRGLKVSVSMREDDCLIIRAYWPEDGS